MPKSPFCITFLAYIFDIISCPMGHLFLAHRVPPILDNRGIHKALSNLISTGKRNICGLHSMSSLHFCADLSRMFHTPSFHEASRNFVSLGAAQSLVLNQSCFSCTLCYLGQTDVEIISVKYYVASHR